MSTYSLVLRGQIDRKLTISDLDNNFLYLEGLSGLGSTGPQGSIGFTMVNPPSNSIGSPGNLQGMLAFDSVNMYYCIQNFGGMTYSGTALVGGDSNPSGILFSLDSPFETPQIGWNLYYLGQTGSMTSVVAQGDNFVIFWSPSFVIASSGILTYGPVSVTDIWVKQAWGVTGSW